MTLAFVALIALTLIILSIIGIFIIIIKGSDRTKYVSLDDEEFNYVDKYMQKLWYDRIDTQIIEKKLAAARRQRDREITTTINFSWGYYNGTP